MEVKMENTLWLYNEMLDKGITLDIVAYTSMIDGYCKEGNIQAFKLHDEMVGMGRMPNVSTLSYIINGI